MTSQELKKSYIALYDYMANSNDPDIMKTFGSVATKMFYWMADAKPELAYDWLEQLSSIKWSNYLTSKEAEKIAMDMVPKAKWSKEQWKAAMAQHEFPTESQPAYNSCALWITMNMIMSDSSDTLEKYVDEEDVFPMAYELALDKLTDEDGVFNIRRYFDL